MSFKSTFRNGFLFGVSIALSFGCTAQKPQLPAMDLELQFKKSTPQSQLNLEHLVQVGHKTQEYREVAALAKNVCSDADSYIVFEYILFPYGYNDVMFSSAWRSDRDFQNPYGYVCQLLVLYAKGDGFGFITNVEHPPRELSEHTDSLPVINGVTMGFFHLLPDANEKDVGKKKMIAEKYAAITRQIHDAQALPPTQSSDGSNFARITVYSANGVTWLSGLNELGVVPENNALTKNALDIFDLWNQILQGQHIETKD